MIKKYGSIAAVTIPLALGYLTGCTIAQPACDINISNNANLEQVLMDSPQKNAGKRQKKWFSDYYNSRPYEYDQNWFENLGKGMIAYASEVLGQKIEEPKWSENGLTSSKLELALKIADGLRIENKDKEEIKLWITGLAVSEMDRKLQDRGLNYTSEEMKRLYSAKSQEDIMKVIHSIEQN